jgi:hypothetical protein
MKSKLLAGLVLSSSLFSMNLWADEEGAFLDAPYKGLTHPKQQQVHSPEGFNAFSLVPRKSDTSSVIAQQTAVKSQAARGTCSIFSATALLEGLLVKKGAFAANLDLSEEWLQYVVTRNKSSDGSTSRANFNALGKVGTPEEKYLPYIGETWDSVDFSQTANERCGKVPEQLVTGCLISHRDPRLFSATDDQLMDLNSPLHDEEFLKARGRAREFKAKYLKMASSNYSVSSTNEIKDLLRQGIPLTLDLDFFYGAWNHRKGPELGIPRNMDHWNRGIIGYPEKGSVDRAKSFDDPAGHSIVVVGYDDDVEVSVPTLMADGSQKTFTYRGVYYIKNSWGTGGFGAGFQLDGAAHPGYGMITQKYAHEFGGFYRLPLN